MSKLLVARLSAALATTLLPTAAFAVTFTSTYDITVIMTNLANILDPAMVFACILSYVLGVYFVVHGIMMFKSFAMPLTQMSKSGELSGPVMYLIVGGVLMYIPSTTDVLTNTFFGVGSQHIWNHGPSLENMYSGSSGNASLVLLGYTTGSGVQGNWSQLVNTLVLYMEFIGFIAFMRGWVIIVHAGQPGAQQGSISKGIIHVVGGILAINFLPLVQAIQNTILTGA